MYNDKKRNLFIGTKSCLYRSKDLGSTWSIINQDFGLTNCLNEKGETIRQTTSSISSITSFNNTLIALVSNGFYFSKNDGDNWEKMIINNKEVESRLNCYWVDQDGDFGIIHIKDSFLFFAPVYDSATLFRYNLFTNTALGIHSDIINEQNSFYIYPNPLQTDGSLQVQAYLPPSSRSYITVSDMLGKTLQTIELGSQDSYSEVKAPVSTEGLSNGVYMIQLHVNGNVISDKVIINR